MRAMACELLSSVRRGHRASSSSRKTTHGLLVRARWKTWRTARSLSPTNLFRSSGPWTEMKLAWVLLAKALASSVYDRQGQGDRSTCLGVGERDMDEENTGCGQE